MTLSTPHIHLAAYLEGQRIGQCSYSVTRLARLVSCDFAQTNGGGCMVNRRRPREPTRPDRPITRSYTRQAEERAQRKLRLSEFDLEIKPTLPIKTHDPRLHQHPMAFSYPRFNGETDAATHVRLFLNVWNANHMAQRLPEEEAHQ